MNFARLRPVRVAVATAMLVGIAACDSNSPTEAATKTAPAAATGGTATAKDWAQVISTTPQGGIRVGNPDAPVKLVEFASFTCPHCAEFKEQGLPALLRNYVAPGKVSFEFRSFARNGVDVAASLVAMCQPPAAAWKLTEAFFASQAAWTEPFTKFSEADSQRFAKLPADRQIVEYADAGGLDDFVRLRGVPKAKFEQCLTNKANLDKLGSINKDAIETYKLTGTPTFVLNGETVAETYTWAALEPKLKEALN